MYLIFTRRCYFMCFFIVLFVIYCVPQISANPTAAPNSLYDQFITFLNKERCQMPSEIILPFNPTPDKTNKWEFLSDSLQICQTSKYVEKKELPNIVCSEIFDVLTNITCVLDHTVSLPKIEVPISSNVCPDFTKKKNLLSNKPEYLGKRLADLLVCMVTCGGEVESACKFLLWSYEVQNQIYGALGNLEEDVTDHRQSNGSNLRKSENLLEPSNKEDNNAENKLNTVDSAIKNAKEDLLENHELYTYDSNPKKTPVVDKTLPNKNIEDKVSLIEANVENKNLSDHSITLTSKPSTPVLNLNTGTGNQHEVLENKNLKQTKIATINNEKGSGTNQVTSEATIQNLNVPENTKIETETVVKNDNDIVKSEINTVENDLYEKLDDSDTQNKLHNKETSTKQALKNSDGEKTEIEISTKHDAMPKEINEEKAENHISSLPFDVIPKETNKGKTENHISSVIDGMPKENTDDKTKKTTFSVSGKTAGQEVKESISRVPITIPKETAEIPKEEELEVPAVIEDSQKLSVVSSTIAVLLEKMEGANEVQPPLDKDQEQYPDLESTEGDFEGEYPRSEFEGSVEQISRNKESDSKVPEPPKSSGAQLDEDSNKIHFKSDDIPINQGTFPEQEDNHFFFYFLSIILIVMAGYLIFHNKQKIIALIVEGRHEKRRRAHGVGYKKLETK